MQMTARTVRRVRWPVLLALAFAIGPLVAGAAEPGDVKFVRQAAGMDDVPPASFPHWIHRLQYRCYACHEAMFKMKTGDDLVTMDQIQNGQSCGACHDGKTAFISNLSTCTRCHRE
jgi:c(7)-type cytochrome triheme protein